MEYMSVAEAAKKWGMTPRNGEAARVVEERGKDI